MVNTKAQDPIITLKKKSLQKTHISYGSYFLLLASLILGVGTALFFYQQTPSTIFTVKITWNHQQVEYKINHSFSRILPFVVPENEHPQVQFKIENDTWYTDKKFDKNPITFHIKNRKIKAQLIYISQKKYSTNSLKQMALKIKEGSATKEEIAVFAYMFSAKYSGKDPQQQVLLGTMLSVQISGLKKIVTH